MIIIAVIRGHPAEVTGHGWTPLPQVRGLDLGDLNQQNGEAKWRFQQDSPAKMGIQLDLTNQNT